MGEIGWHTPPGSVLTVWLDGIVKFETSDGEVRHVSAGGSMLVEDTRGKGHISRHPKEEQRLILITLPEGLETHSNSRSCRRARRMSDRMSPIGTNRRLEVGQSMSALPGYFRHQLAQLWPKHHLLRCLDI
jgi:hypothetical protein